MYDDLMQLIALAKNDEQYFKRIEDLKQMQLELGQVKEIAKTLGEADLYLANARQRAEAEREKVEKECNELRESAIAYVEEQKKLLEEAKALKATIKADKAALQQATKEAKEAVENSLAIDKERREMTALRNAEVAETQKLRKTLQDSFNQIKQIINYTGV